MKKVLCLFMLLLLISSSGYAESYDLSSYDTEALTNLDIAIRSELSRRYIDSASSLDTATSCDEEITFRSVAWGTSADIAKETLMSTGFLSNKCELESSARLEPWSIDPEDNDSYWDSGIRLYQYSFAETTKVAGYNVGTVNLYFMYDYDGNVVKRDAKDSSLYMATMKLESSDYDLAYADLVNKLSSLYGKATETSDVSGFWSTGGNYHQYDWWAYWYGANNTAVLLHLTYDVLDEDGRVKDFSEELTLYYGKTDSEQRLKALASGIEEEAKEAERVKILDNANNTDGL